MRPCALASASFCARRPVQGDEPGSIPVQPFGSSANRSWLSCLGNASGLAALPNCGRTDSDRYRGEILMFHRFRSMPATAMADVLGCALMATAETPAVDRAKPKEDRNSVVAGKKGEEHGE